jgi:hypothetical protein
MVFGLIVIAPIMMVFGLVLKVPFMTVTSFNFVIMILIIVWETQEGNV